MTEKVAEDVPGIWVSVARIGDPGRVESPGFPACLLQPFWE